jgi:hypothetical protein
MQTFCSRHVAVLHSTKRITLSKVAYFLKNHYRPSVRYSELSGASVVSASQVRASAMLLLLIAGNEKLRNWGFNAKLMKIRLLVQKYKGEAHAHTAWRYHKSAFVSV